MVKRLLVIGVFFLLVVSSIGSLSFSNNVILNEKEIDRYFYPEFYDCYNISEIVGYGTISGHECNDFINSESKETDIIKETLSPLNGPPLDSPWPMYCHDVRHTGQSPYSTANITSFEKWRFYVNDWNWGSAPIIDNNGTIYFPENYYLYAIYPNGTLKWQFYIGASVESAPAIDEDGIVYVGTSYHWDGIYAIYPNGTMKWKYQTGQILSSPAIADDGTIYFGTNEDGEPNTGFIYALNPNGTLKWRFTPGHLVYSSPAIGSDGTVYCGCHDTYLYALYPDNGTMKWKYKTNHWVRVSPCIADDGTIYCVSLDNYLHAVAPNGTLKWKKDVGAGTSPTIGQDGTIYCGYDRLYAVNPNGSGKWIFNPGSDRRIRGSTPCNSVEGTIYFGTNIGESGGGEIIAVNPDGTEKWRKMIADDWVESAPCIGEDGTIYIGSTSERGCYLHAFGDVESNSPPNAPVISGPTNVNVGDKNWFTFIAIDPDNNPIQLFVDWGDGTSGWIGEYASGEKIWVEHAWNNEGTYIVKAKVKDVLGEESDFGYLEVKVIVPPVYKKALIYGIITNLTIEDTIMFEAVHIKVVRFLPFSISLFKSGEKFTLSKNYKGFIGNRLIFSLCTMIL
jgi:outer membrane protein assembly factor BamB